MEKILVGINKKFHVIFCFHGNKVTIFIFVLDKGNLEERENMRKENLLNISHQNNKKFQTSIPNFCPRTFWRSEREEEASTFIIFTTFSYAHFMVI